MSLPTADPSSHVQPLDLGICDVVFSLDPLSTDNKVKVELDHSILPLQNPVKDLGRLKESKNGQKLQNSLTFRWYHAQRNCLPWLDFVCAELQPPDLLAACKVFWSKHEQSAERRRGSTPSAATFFLEGRHKSLPSGVAVALPYLAVEPTSVILERQQRQKNNIQRSASQRNVRIDFNRGSKNDARLPQTLYEYLYPSFQSSSGIASEKIRLGKGSAGALVVSQLWMVTLDDTKILTLFPKTQPGGPPAKDCLLTKNLVRRLVEPITADSVYSNVFDLVSLVIQEGVILTLSLLGHHRETIGSIRAEYFSVLEAFRDEQSKSNNELVSVDEGNSLLSKVLTASALQTELHSVNEVIDSQHQVVSLLKSQIWGNTEKATSDSIGDRLLEETLQICTDLQQDLKKLSQEAGQIKIDLLNMLDLQQKRASLQAAHASVRQTAETIRQTNVSVELSGLSARQNRVMIVFTTMTVIFLPLSFFASFFSMQVREFSTDKGAPLTLNTFWIYSIPISFMVVLLASATSFSKEIWRFFHRSGSFLGRKQLKENSEAISA